MGRRLVLMVAVLAWACGSARALVVEGLVNQPDGKAAPGALVAVIDPEADSPRRFWTARCGADGKFAIDLPGRDRLAETQLVATNDAGCASALRADGQPLTLTLQPWVSATARVTGPEGKPVAGAKVLVQIIGEGEESVSAAWPDVDGWPQLAAQTDANGDWTMERFPASGVSVLVTHPEYVDGYAAVLAGAPAEDNSLELELGGAISGRVTGADGKGVPGVAVSAFEQAHVGILATAKTDADGRYRITGLSPGTLAVGLLNPIGPVVAMPRPRVRVKAGGVTEGIDFAGSPGQMLVLTVVDAETGRPLPGVVIDGHLPQGPLPEENRLATDAQGRVAMRVLPGGAFLSTRPLSPWMDLSEGPAEAEVAADKAPQPVTLRLERGRYVQGTLADEAGDAVAGATLNIMVGEAGAFLTAGTDDMGAFEVGPLPKASQLSVTVTEASGYERWSGRIEARELPAEAWKLNVPTVPRTAVVGRVVDSAGRPLADAEVTLSSIAAGAGEPGISDQDVPTDDEGRFRFEGLPAALTYTARAAKAGYRFQRGGGESPARNPLRLEDMVLQGLTGKVSGTVTDAAGKPVAEATVMALGYTDRETLTDEKGRYSLSKLPPGAVRLLAVRGRQTADLTTRTGEANAALKLRTIGTVSRDDERDLAEDLLHAAWKDSAGIEWFERAQVPGAMARFDAVAATAMLAEIDAKDEAGAELLAAGLVDGVRAAPREMLPALKLADALPPARRAHVRLVAGLMALDSPESAQAAALLEQTALPERAGVLTRALRGLLAARLGQAQGQADLVKALAELDDEEALGMWAVGLASVAGENDALLDALAGKLPREAASLVRLAGAWGVCRSHPRVAAARLRAALGDGDVLPDDMPALAENLVSAAVLGTISALPPAEAKALIEALPAGDAAAAGLVAAAAAGPAEVEQRVSAAIKAGAPWPLLPLAAATAPRAARAWLDQHDPEEEWQYGSDQAILLAQGLLAPATARLECERQLMTEAESTTPAVADAGSLIPLAQVDAARTRELIAAIPEASSRCSARLAVARHLAREGAARWIAYFAVTDEAEDFLRMVLLATD